VAGGAGGLTALGMKKAFDLEYWKKYNKLGSKFKLTGSYDYSTQISNPLLKYDVFVMGRGIIAGCVMVSAPSIHYKIWICFLLGAVGGIVSTGVAFGMHKGKVDDPMQVFSTHGVPAALSLVLIVLFHEENGIFFTDPNDIITHDKLQQII
jgi:ammonia channel protein AmtB